MSMSNFAAYADPTGDVLEAVKLERQRQDRLKAEGRFAFTCADAGITQAERFMVLAEEFGEVAHELNEAIGGRALDLGKLRAELVQVAAVAVGWVESIDRDGGR